MAYTYPTPRQQRIYRATTRRRTVRNIAPTYGKPGFPQTLVGAPGQPDANGGNPLPWDTTYEQHVNTINRGRTTSLNALDQQQAGLGSTYGYDAAGNIDTSNPYSRAALMGQAYQRNVAGSTNSYASQGQLYSGALQTAQNFNSSNYAQSNDTLKRQVADIVAQIVQKRAGVNQAADEAIANEDWSRLDRAQADAANNPIDPGEDVAAPVGARLTAGPAKGTVKGRPFHAQVVKRRRIRKGRLGGLTPIRRG